MVNPYTSISTFAKKSISEQETIKTIERLKEENKAAALRAYNAEESAKKAWRVFFYALALFALIAFILVEGCNNQCDNSFVQGKAAGYDDGYSAGYDKGYEDGRRERNDAASIGGSVAYDSPTRSASTEKTTIVYVTYTGSKYHKAGCSYLKSKIEMTLEDARSEGYTPCSRCY